MPETTETSAAGAAPEQAKETPTDDQGIALARLLRRFETHSTTVWMNAFDLPEGYIYALLKQPGGNEIHAGIAPDGTVST